MWNLPIQIIKVGTCTIEPGTVASHTHISLKHQMGIGGGSTVTLIREKEDLLMVDTGFDGEGNISQKNRKRNAGHLEALLHLHGIAPKDITKLFLTHLHHDHMGNMGCFKDAEWYCARKAIKDDDAIRDEFIPVDAGDFLLRQVRVVATPGHTEGHCSLLWSSENGTITAAICGDAIINLAWLQSGYIWKFNSDFYHPEKERESARMLLHTADIIIPGHGQPFFSRSVRRMYGLIEPR